MPRVLWRQAASGRSLVRAVALRLRAAAGGGEGGDAEARLMVRAAMEVADVRARAALPPHRAPANVRLAALLQAWIRRRVEAREPLQYIVGHWDWRDLERVRVRAPVLIPRPETEELASLACQVLTRARPLFDTQGRVVPVPVSEAGAAPARPRILEVGPGTGVVSISLLRELPHATGIAVDVAPAAVQLSRENAAAFGVARRARFLLADALNLPPDALAAVLQPAPCDVLISNPPYIPDADAGSLQPEVARHEDARALFGGPPAGAGFLLAMCAAAVRQRWLRPGALLFLETHTSHPALVHHLLTAGRRHADEAGTMHDAERAAGAATEEHVLPLQPAAWTRDAWPTASGFAPPHLTPEEVAETAESACVDAATRAQLPHLVRTWQPALSGLHFVNAFADLAGRPRFIVLRYAPSRSSSSSSEAVKQ